MAKDESLWHITLKITSPDAHIQMSVGFLDDQRLIPVMLLPVTIFLVLFLKEVPSKPVYKPFKESSLLI